MFFFYFDAPKQITNLQVESLSQFIDLLNIYGNLYSQFKEVFLHDETSVEIRNENQTSYKTYIANKESESKREFAKLINARNNKANFCKFDFNVFYRGICDSSFMPVPSVYRNNIFLYENRFINDIRVANPDFVQGRTYIDELSALQHYGCPTRLLDLTSNPLVALYFACEDVNKSNKATNGCVEFFLEKEENILHSNSDKVLILTALSHLTKKDKDQLFDICDSEIKSRGYARAKLDSKLATRRSVKKLYQEILRVTNFDKDILCIDLLQSFYVQPAFNNLRIRAQSGLFLINGLCLDEKECSNRNENKIFAKITIPFSAKRKILEELDKVNINSKTLFPEIEDTVDYLKSKYK